MEKYNRAAAAVSEKMKEAGESVFAAFKSDEERQASMKRAEEHRAKAEMLWNQSKEPQLTQEQLQQRQQQQEQTEQPKPQAQGQQQQMQVAEVSQRQNIQGAVPRRASEEAPKEQQK